MSIRRNTSLIAVDFGATSVRLLQVAGQHVTAMELPCEIFASNPGGDPDPGGLAADLVRVIAYGGFHGRRCAVTLPAGCFLIDTVSAPEVDDADRLESLRWDAVERFGVDSEDITVGSLPIRAPQTAFPLPAPPGAPANALPSAPQGAPADGAPPPAAPNATPAAPPSPALAHQISASGAEHLLIALRRATAMNALDPLIRAELAPVRIESSALAGLRTTWAHWSRTTSEPLAFVHIEPALATVLLARDGELLFHRAIPGVFAVPRSPTIVSGASHGGHGGHGGHGDAIPVEMRAPAADRRAFRWSGLADEILQCLRYVERRGAGQWPTGLVTSGPCGGQVELLATLESICGVPSHSASGAGVVDPLPATLSPSTWAAALGAAAVDLEQQTLLDARRAA